MCQVVPAERYHRCPEAMQQTRARAGESYVQPVVITRTDVERRLNDIEPNAAGQTEHKSLYCTPDPSNQQHYSQRLDRLLHQGGHHRYCYEKEAIGPGILTILYIGCVDARDEILHPLFVREQNEHDQEHKL